MEQPQDQGQQEKAAEIWIPPGPRLGGAVIEARGLTKGYGDRVLMEDVNFSLPAGGIVGIIGPNGAGKTTLFRMIVGQEKPDSGTLRIGETVQLAYVDQSRDALDGNKSVFEEISGGQEALTLGQRKLMSRASRSLGTTPKPSPAWGMPSKPRITIFGLPVCGGGVPPQDTAAATASTKASLRIANLTRRGHANVRRAAWFLKPPTC